MKINKDKYDSSKRILPVSVFDPVVVIKINFLILLFFTLFGTGLPFQDRYEDASDIGTSNIVNQIMYGLLFISSVIVIFPHYKRIASFIAKEKFLTMFITWCFLSIFWSNNSFISFKRFFQVFTTFLVIMEALLFIDHHLLWKYFKYIILVYIILTFLSVLLVPGAMDPKAFTWRGIAAHKNGLGQVAVLFFTLSPLLFGDIKNWKTQYVIIAIPLASIILIFMSSSSTSILTFMFILGAGLIFGIDKIFASLRIGRFMSTIVIIYAFAFLLVLINYSSELANIVPQFFDKDMTFSGRTDLWADIWIEIQRHIIIGCGFQSYWIVDSVHIEILYEIYNWLPNQAHNGYLDIMNELGIIGITLFLLILASLIIKSVKINNNFLLIIIISILVMNFLETIIIKPGTFATFIFMYTYLYASTKFYNSKQNI